MSKTFEWVEGERFLGKEVGKIIVFLAKTSCMAEEERVLYANVEIFSLFLKFNQKSKGEIDFNRFIDEIVKPSIELLGYANWNRDILTDLSLKTSLNKPPRESLKRLRKDE